MIGIDFDNTIICYDEVFNQVAIEKNLISAKLPSGKSYVRDYLRSMGQEEEWIKLQGYVYGTRLSDAHPFEGVKDFFSYCKEESIDFCIVSHKTKHPYKGYPYDLHSAAYQWLEQENINCKIFFELTKEEKVKRIFNLGCTHFIDDLPEFLTLQGFSQTLSKILFDPLRNHEDIHNDVMKVVTSWKDLLGILKQGLL
ncbi:HAD family hydrolase [Desulfobacula phenolica]|uniref:Haloacid dehalogenase-like hydrolase n=1 Tax=Desulfobacula phenolica TaxID=90732 RepID=A0A1H2DRL9_9BACT|nr:hypothetical protein [Desulfobacula phenolica]SDT85522.1 hypothetical protein SAMN04487931_10237 [Desulfobacula phenolica]